MQVPVLIIMDANKQTMALIKIRSLWGQWKFWICTVASSGAWTLAMWGSRLGTSAGPSSRCGPDSETFYYDRPSVRSASVLLLDLATMELGQNIQQSMQWRGCCQWGPTLEQDGGCFDSVSRGLISGSGAESDLMKITALALVTVGYWANGTHIKIMSWSSQYRRLKTRFVVWSTHYITFICISAAPVSMLSAGWGPARCSHHNKLYQYHPWQPAGEMKITWARLQGDDIVLYMSRYFVL